MKKIILASLLALSSTMVFAATACSGGTATTVPGATDGTKFVRSDFTPSCSTNTVVVYDDSDSSKLYGGSASLKGASYFGASTNGGAVKRVGACASNNCGGDEATTKAGSGKDDAASYGSAASS